MKPHLREWPKGRSLSLQIALSFVLRDENPDLRRIK